MSESKQYSPTFSEQEAKRIVKASGKGLGRNAADLCKTATVSYLNRHKIYLTPEEEEMTFDEIKHKYKQK